MENLDHVLLNVVGCLVSLVRAVKKRRSPHFRHVTCTHRVDLAGWFERMNHRDSLSILSVCTKGQIADFLTKRNIQQHKKNWNTFLRLFDMHIHLPATGAIPWKTDQSDALAYFPYPVREIGCTPSSSKFSCRLDSRRNCAPTPTNDEHRCLVDRAPKPAMTEHEARGPICCTCGMTSS